ncbi:hypothetical protein ABT115_14570 [Streptomyces sp. NPDC001832]|uniref:hypothetical protein n=1 Tax=Streptomyces sp. NPDC001832 TaxID=3154527 RepID=UPI003330F651
MDAAAVVGLAPGGSGNAEAVEVTGGSSASAYRSLNGAVAYGFSWAAPLLEVATEGTLVALGLLLVWAWWGAVRRGGAPGCPPVPCSPASAPSWPTRSAGA